MNVNAEFKNQRSSSLLTKLAALQAGLKLILPQASLATAQEYIFTTLAGPDASPGALGHLSGCSCHRACVFTFVGLLSLWLGFGAASSWGATVAWRTFQEGTPDAIASGTGSVPESVHGFNGTPRGQPIYRLVGLPVCSQQTSLALE